MVFTQTSATEQAREYHGQALVITQELGVPLEEARALEGIGQSLLQDGDPARAAERLRQALAIYQRIGAADARRVHKTFREHGLTGTSGRRGRSDRAIRG
jgi:hypothetical protein